MNLSADRIPNNIINIHEAKLKRLEAAIAKVKAEVKSRRSLLKTLTEACDSLRAPSTPQCTKRFRQELIAILSSEQRDKHGEASSNFGLHKDVQKETPKMSTQAKNRTVRTPSPLTNAPRVITKQFAHGKVEVFAHTFIAAHGAWFRHFADGNVQKPKSVRLNDRGNLVRRFIVGNAVVRETLNANGGAR